MRLKFHLFKGEDYYPQSGLGDYLGSFATAEEALQFARDHPNSDDNWVEVITHAESGALVRHDARAILKGVMN